MSLHIKVLDGPAKDQELPLHAGFLIGRTEGDLRIPDDKMSGRHAYIEVDPNGQWFLVDNGSKNGLRLDGIPATRILLAAGQKIQIGSFFYEIFEQAAAVPSRPRPRARHWQEILLEFGQEQLAKQTNEASAVTPFHPAVVLDVIRGTQAETRWVLGYGPRRIGRKSFDLPIYEPNAPDVCFELLPTPDGILFRTNHPDMVKLNGTQTSSGVLRVADVITIFDSEIEVDFIE